MELAAVTLDAPVDLITDRGEEEETAVRVADFKLTSAVSFVFPATNFVAVVVVGVVVVDNIAFDLAEVVAVDAVSCCSFLFTCSGRWLIEDGDFERDPAGASDAAGNDADAGAADAAGNDADAGAADTAGNDADAGAADVAGNDADAGAADVVFVVFIGVCTSRPRKFGFEAS